MATQPTTTPQQAYESALADLARANVVQLAIVEAEAAAMLEGF